MQKYEKEMVVNMPAEVNISEKRRNFRE